MVNPRYDSVRCLRTKILGVCVRLSCTFQLRGEAAIGIDDPHEITTQNNESRTALALLKLSNCQQRGFLAETFDIGPGEAFHLPGEFIEINVKRERNAAAAQAHDGGTIGSVGLIEVEYVIEAPAAHERGIDPLGTVAGGEQDHSLDVAQVVDLTEQLAENSLKNVRTELIGAEPGRERVERVEEQDAGRGPSRLLENLAQRALGFTQPLRVELRAVDGDQRNLLLARERSRQCGLAGARRSYQQNAARRSQSDLLVDFVAHVRVLDDGIEHSLDLVQASERGKRRRAFLDKELAGGAGFDFFQAGEKVF